MRRKPTAKRKVRTTRKAASRKTKYQRPLRDARATQVADRLRLPRAAKGKRAQFYKEPAIDQLFGIAAALAAELSVAFERIQTLEQVLARHGHLDHTELEDYEPDDTESVERASAREALIERVFQVLEVTDSTS
jgi:adenylate cyclase class IV